MLQMPLPAEDSSPAEPAAAPLLQAGMLLANRGIFGVVWFGVDAIATARFGRLVEFVEIGQPVFDSVPALIGLESDFLRLRSAPGTVVDLPSVSIVRAAGTATPRAHLTVIWAPEQNSFLMLVGRSTSNGDLEIELSRQMRARLMAEAEVSAKSKELARVNAGLERANMDLEAFASIISHDLKAPMRALRYMVDDLDAVLLDKSTPGVERMLHALREQSRRMSGMLTALLDYSSVTQKSDALEDVDTAALAAAIVTSMPHRERFTISIEGAWPRTETLAAPLDLVLRNLIDNAMKHHDRVLGTIKLHAAVVDGSLMIDVEDDGPGILPEHQEAAFLPFRKLDHSANTEGHGMGLALVRRVVEGVGGQLTLHSGAPAVRGTRFTLLWPLTIS